jgi:hydroxymethylpyrimidine/phosphomethylpyrimidine kinase
MTRTRPPRALTIAGSDSGAGAGIQADLKTFAARGVYGTSAISAVTAQNSRAVRAVLSVPAAFVRAQIDAVWDDLGADAVKTGMLGGAGVVVAVADALCAHRARHIVVDPVMTAKDGVALLAPRGADALRARLLPLAEVITPNLDEAAALVGFPVGSIPAMRAAAQVLARAGPRAVVVTGGHLRGDAVDVLWLKGAVHVLRAARIPAPAPHGTGCTFSAAIAAELAKGAGIEAAVRIAKRFTLACIRRATRMGGGHPMLGYPRGRA